MKSLLLSVFVFCIVLFVACNDEDPGLPFTRNSQPPPPSEILLEDNIGATDYKFDRKRGDISLTISGDTATIKSKQKLIKNGFIKFECTNIDSLKDLISSIVNSYKATITSDNKTENDYTVRNYMTIRVSAGKFEEMVADFDKISGDYEKREIIATDLTEEFIDLQARIKTKTELEKRYLALLSKAGKVEEMLKVEREIESVRSDIERMTGRINYINDRVAESTLRLEYFETKEYVSEGPPPYLERLGKSFKRGWRTLTNFFLGLVSIWPIVILIGGVIIIIYRKIKKSKTAS